MASANRASNLPSWFKINEQNATSSIFNIEDHPSFNYYSNKLTSDCCSLDEIYRKLSSRKTPMDKYKYVRTLLMKRDLLPKMKISHPEVLYHTEFLNNIASGIWFLKKKRYNEAFHKFSHCMLCHQPGTDDHALALIYRSVVLYCMKDYENCRKDIQRAYSSRYMPKKYREHFEQLFAEDQSGIFKNALSYYDQYLKLSDYSNANQISTKKQRNAYLKEIADDNCQGLKELLIGEDKKDIQEENTDILLGGPNSDFPALSKCVEVKHSNDMGRGIYATTDINPGDIIAIEDPYVATPIRNYIYVCHYGGCLKLNTNVIPCKNCMEVYYCDEECLKKDFKDVHRFECSMLSVVRSMPGLAQSKEFALKWFLQEVSKTGLDSYCSTFKKFLELKNNSKTGGLINIDQYKSDQFLLALTLETDDSKMSPAVSLFYYCVAVDIISYLNVSGSLKIPEHLVPIVGASLVHMMNLLYFNSIKLCVYNPHFQVEFDGPDAKKEHFRTPIVTALYATSSLINHSCNPNVMRSGRSTDSKLVLRALQPIKKGSQLTISYGVTYYDNDFEKRFQFCQDYLKFKCCCQPCKENWLMSEFLPMSISPLNVINPDMIDTLIKECEKFMKLKDTLLNSEDVYASKDYLFDFIKLMFTNVKQPFQLYIKCLKMIRSSHLIFVQDIYPELMVTMFLIDTSE